MYISDKYWENYVGDTDDSLTLVEYLVEKQKEEISLKEILSDFGLDKLQGDFQKPDIPLVYTNSNGFEIPIYYAINLIADLAALLLECKVNKGIDMHELDNEETTAPDMIRIITTPEERELINKALADFTAAPLSYDLSEMVPEEDMMEMAAICEELRKELYES